MTTDNPFKHLLLELACLASVVAGHLLIQWQLGDFYFTLKDGSVRTLAIVYSTLPAIFAFAVVRLLLPNVLSMALVTGSDLILAVVNLQKMGRINEVLSWSDLANVGENISVVAQFIQPIHFVIVGLTIVFLLLALRINRRIDNSIGYLLYKFVIIAALGPVIFNNHLVNEKIVSSTNAIANTIQSLGLKSTRAQWDLNVRKYGLDIHLIQTSARSVPSKATPAESALAKAVAEWPMPSTERRKKIVVILCEACWHGDSEFREAFKPLLDQGFRAMRGISPSYGGGTANASFEWQTGLPANGVLSGVVYQEYTGIMRNNVNSIAQSLRSEGYKTIMAHNYRRKFWHRHEVKPKLGYDRFIGIEDMDFFDYDKRQRGWVDDEILYRNVHQFIDSEEPTFLYLTTMFTHAPVRHKGDLGENDYLSRLKLAIQRIAEFAEYAKAKHDVTIVIYGDHKPLMTDFFIENGIFSRDLFFKIGQNDSDYIFSDSADQRIVGDVPVYIYDKDQEKTERFVERASGLPFFCQSALLNEYFIGTDLLAHQFALKNNLCSESKQYDYEALKKPFPEWLYSISMF